MSKTALEIATQVLALHDAEILVLYVPAAEAERILENLRMQLASLIPEVVRKRVAVVVLAPGMELQALSKAELRRIGLARIEQ